MSLGYLEQDYLDSPYGSGVGTPSAGIQVNQIIKNRPSSEGMQIDMVIKEAVFEGMQAHMSVVKGQEYGFQVRQVIGAADFNGGQVNGVIESHPATGMQVLMATKNVAYDGMQARQIINEEHTTGFQIDMTVVGGPKTGMQAQMSFPDQVMARGLQSEMKVGVYSPACMQAYQSIVAPASGGMQVLQYFPDQTTAAGVQAHMTAGGKYFAGMQLDATINADPAYGGMQAKQDTLRHWLCDEGGYLSGGYLEDDYFSYCMRAFLGMQVDMIAENKLFTGAQIEAFIKQALSTGMQAHQIVKLSDATGMQARRTVREAESTGFQALMRMVDRTLVSGMQSRQLIHAVTPSGMQVRLISIYRDGMQATMVIYNNTQLRVMYEFPSRGTEALGGANWTMAPSAASGDFSPNNLNTDIMEQVTRSTTAGNIELVCDTGLTQGVPVDTIAILNHNLTRSAIVQVQGAKNAGFAPADIVFRMEVKLDNMFWIAEKLPTLLGQNRYWKFTIQDPTNPDGHIEIGAILFGVSNIFSLSEAFSNPIEHGYKHFKDEVEIEGYTNIMNDRAFRKWIRLRFEDLDYVKGNFKLLDEMLKTVRTNLKTLVIPTPLFPDRYAVFAKLVDMPSFSNRVIDDDADYTSLELEWDESK